MMRTLNWTRLIILGLFVVACSSNHTIDGTSPTPFSQTPTMLYTATPDVPYIAIVDGQGIHEALYNASLLQLEQALAQGSINLPQGMTAEQRVIDDLIDLTLLAQAARTTGFQADDGLVEERIKQLVQQLGGQDALAVWMDENGYDDDSFRLALALEIEAAWQRDQIAASVPVEAEQVRARQVLFYDPYLAERAYEQLEQGSPIEAIIASADPQNQGYLDWVPRGYLLVPELDEVLFSLQPGQYSQVIQTDLGYHILYVIERQENRPLSDDALLALQAQTLHQWLQTQRDKIEIEILLP